MNINSPIQTITVQGKGQAPKISMSNSVYEKIDNEDSSIITSRTFYDSQGRPFVRQDYYRGSDPHTHYEKLTGETYTDHEHIFNYNDRGYLDKKNSYTAKLDSGGW